MNSYVYAAQVGDYVKIGYSWLPSERLINLRSEYRCAVTLLGVIDADYRDELKFHAENASYAVGPELYPKDAPPIIEFLSKAVPYKRTTKGRWPHRPGKWSDPLPPGVIPVSRFWLKRRALLAQQATAGAPA